MPCDLKSMRDDELMLAEGAHANTVVSATSTEGDNV